MITLRL
jgi:hypothetical protein